MNHLNGVSTPFEPSPSPSTFALFELQEEDSDDANEQAREEHGLPAKAALRWAVFEDHGEICVMPGIRAKSSTKKTDHVQVREIKQGGRAKSHCTYEFSSCFFPKFKVMHFQKGDIKLYTVVLLFLCFLKILTKLCCRWSWSRRPFVNNCRVREFQIPDRRAQ